MLPKINLSKIKKNELQELFLKSIGKICCASSEKTFYGISNFIDSENFTRYSFDLKKHNFVILSYEYLNNFYEKKSTILTINKKYKQYAGLYMQILIAGKESTMWIPISVCRKPPINYSFLPYASPLMQNEKYILKAAYSFLCENFVVIK
jgi:hypothetical protein